jgi:starvation-inducible DNA-binding protein
MMYHCAIAKMMSKIEPVGSLDGGRNTDEIAERAVELGGVALGTIQIVGKSSRLSAYPLDASSGKSHVAALSSVLVNFGKTTRAAIDAVGKIGDADTADLFTEVSRGVDKLLWMVEAHAQAND